MMNIYGMWSKGQAEDTYRDFIREEGIPTRLHRDNSGEQKSDGFKETNRVHHVKDSWTEPYHPHQNPAETRAMAFLKRVATSLIIMSGAPMGLWLYAMKYVVMINNWTSHESLGWKTPYEKRHGVPPDISPYWLTGSTNRYIISLMMVFQIQGSVLVTSSASTKMSVHT